MRRTFFVFSALVCSALFLAASHAQTPAPIIIQAATPAPAVANRSLTSVEEKSTQSTLQLLQEMKTTNAATISKQEAALATLDDLQKAAEEIKIFSKRG
jgi:predicted component of type VI protein secretion system